jgi:hypothetical protein
MPGHFTHIYTARRVADLLATGEFLDWPAPAKGGDAVAHYDPKTCNCSSPTSLFGKATQVWRKYETNR